MAHHSKPRSRTAARLRKAFPPNELTLQVKQRQNWQMNILATRNLLATAVVGVLAGMMTSLKPTGFGNP
jgi:hypothetical protein